MDNIFILPALNAGLDLMTEAAVSQILTQGSRAIGIRYHDARGDEKDVFAEKVILAAGALGSPRILLNSRGSSPETGLANSSGLVGKNLMMHPMGYARGVFQEGLDTDVGPHGAFLYSLQHRRVESTTAEFGYMMQVLRGDDPIESARAAYHLGLLELGPRLVESFESFYKKNLGIAVLVEDAPRHENSVSLWADQVDQFGVPGVRVVYQVDSNSKKLLAHGLAKASAVLVEAGATKVFKHAPVRNVGWHMMGTLKMGESATESVVSPTGETHDIKGLYVFDSSVFVTGSCVNPANTVQALALLLADRVANE